MNTNSSLINELRQKDYREAYVASQISIGLPFQIRALRTHHGWNQAEFARRLGMSQPRVSEMERPGERRLNIETLLRIAAAFDVGLQIRFISFGNLVEWSESFSPDAFMLLGFNEEISAKEKDHKDTQSEISSVLKEKATGADRRSQEIPPPILETPQRSKVISLQHYRDSDSGNNVMRINPNEATSGLHSQTNRAYGS